MAFIKLHSSILDSSVWLEDDKTRIVWFTLMAMANRDGVVEASVPGLAHRARVPRRACERAIEIFMSPDPDSRTETEDGRRIEKVEGGWRLINYQPYREKDSADDVREKTAERVRRYRANHRDVTPCNVTSVTVTAGNSCNSIGEGEGEGEGDAEAEGEAEGDPDAPVTVADGLNFWAPRTAHGLLLLFGKLWADRTGNNWNGRSLAARAATAFMDRPGVELTVLAPLLRPAIDRFLADGRDWYVKRGHPFDAFVKDFDAHATPARKASEVAGKPLPPSAPDLRP